MVDEDIQKHLIDEVLEYLVWLQEPNEAFEGMPVCPFVKKDFENNDIEYIMYSPDMEFMDVVDRYGNSGRKTGLAILIGLPPALFGGRRKYQIHLNKEIAKKYPKSDEQPKVLVFDPDEEWSIAGVETRKKAPVALINLARRGDLKKAHRDLLSTKWYKNLSKEDLKRLHSNPTIYNKENKDELAHNKQEG